MTLPRCYFRIIKKKKRKKKVKLLNAYHIISFFTHENLKRMPVWILKLILPNWAQLCSFPSCFRVRIFSLGCTVDQDLPVSWFEYNLNFQIFPNPASHVNSHYRSHWNGIASLLTYKQYFNISMSICVSSASTSASSFFFSTPAPLFYYDQQYKIT